VFVCIIVCLVCDLFPDLYARTLTALFRANTLFHAHVPPENVRAVLQALRGPAPVDSAEVEECLIILTDGDTEDR
jgi:hypothetical protein